MYLLLGQLVYTSFAGRGFRTLASPHVPLEIQQAFMQHVVSQYWDSYNPPKSGYRAVYLHQVTPEQTLFGWLYNDGTDDMGRSDIPYFVCYYLAEPLFDFQLANIFTCLERGPVAVVDRHSRTACIETKMTPNLWNYQPAQSGVAIPLHIRQQSYFTLRQGELLNLFVPVYEQEMVIDLNGQTYEQQIANLSIYTRYVIDGIEVSTTALDRENPATDASYKQKLQPYKQPVGKKNQREYPLKIITPNLLVNKNLRASKSRHRQTVIVEPAFRHSFANQVLQQNISKQPNLSRTLNQNTNNDSGLAYRKTQLLLKIGIAATVLALASAIYGLQQANISNSNTPETNTWASNSIIYKTLAEVPNIPQGVFKYGGSTSFAPLRSQAIVSAIAKAHPKFQLLYSEPSGNRHGSTIGIKMLLAGGLSFTQSSRPIKDTELAQAQKLGFNLKQIPIAIDGIALYVNPSIAIPGLRLFQIRDIFAGKITNWNEVGGPNLPITPFSRNPEFSGTANFLKEKVLAGKNLGKNVREVETTTDSIRLVAKTPGGIGYATASEVVGQQSVDPLSLASINPLPLAIKNNYAFVSPFEIGNKNVINLTAFADGSYPLTRRLFVIVKQDGGVDEQAGTGYASLLFSQEGQKIIERVGFVPLRR